MAEANEAIENVRIPGPQRAWQVIPRLFDLRDDPHEDRDLRGAESQRAEALAARWATWDAELTPPRKASDPGRPAGEKAAAPALP